MILGYKTPLFKVILSQMPNLDGGDLFKEYRMDHKRRKTWVKLKRGLLIDPKHRLALGNRIWLYMYMLDVTDWSTGKILEWRDKDAADEMQMPITTIRTQRREIEDAGYISCRQYSNRQTITIKRWVNPREYGGKVYNTDGEEWDIDEGDEEPTPEKPKGVNEGDKEGVNEGTQNLTPLHINHISHITSQYAQNEITFLEACARVYQELMKNLVFDFYSFELMVTNFEKHGVTLEDYGNAIIAMQKNPKYKRATKPTSFEQYALGLAEKRNNPVHPARFVVVEPERKLQWAHEMEVEQ
jgi:hypothetical protein